MGAIAGVVLVGIAYKVRKKGSLAWLASDIHRNPRSV